MTTEAGADNRNLIIVGNVLLKAVRMICMIASTEDLHIVKFFDVNFANDAWDQAMYLMLGIKNNFLLESFNRGQ